MRTNIVLDDDLVKRAIKYSKKKTKKGLIDQALREFVMNHSRLDLRDLRGKIEISEDYDHKALRRGD